MKIKHCFITIGILCIAVFSAMIITTWNKHVLVLADGEMIEADRIWQVFNTVYYEQGEETLYSVEKEDVDEIFSASFSSLNDWQIILGLEIEQKKGIFSILLNHAVWKGAFLLFCAFLLAFFIHQRNAVKSRKHENKSLQDSEEPVEIHIDPAASDMEKVVLYFLNIYLLQLKAKKKDSYRFLRLDTKGPQKTTVYSLQRRMGDRWQSRRMSLGPIGEGSGSKSKCFYVVFDDNMVVKLPSSPVTNFNDYISSIKAEKRIADILAPRECLTPKVSLVLKRIPAFANTVGEYAKTDEQECIKILTEFPQFQKFLKIGKNFAFYMDLSRHFFLKHILEELNDVEKDVSTEIKKHSEIIWSPLAFEDRYGKNTAPLCQKLQNAFELFEKNIDPDIPTFKKKEWFTDSLSKENAEKRRKEMPVVAEMLLKKISADYHDTFTTFDRSVKNFVRGQSFNQHKSEIQGICTNLIDLLAWLGSKNIAMRDLKPENLLVVGAPSSYPNFLKSADAFEIGLIDVETAAYTDPKTRITDQPRLGWTLWYATPSHMFVNEILKQLYHDIPYILHLQDWQAIVVMIFETITGEKPLFHAAKTLAGISRDISQYFGTTSGMLEFAKQSGPKFWKAAAVEFKARLHEKKHRFSSVNLDIGRNARQMFEAAAARSSREKTRKQLLDIKSGISAYDLLDRMFRHIRDVMYHKDW